MRVALVVAFVVVGCGKAKSPETRALPSHDAALADARPIAGAGAPVEGAGVAAGSLIAETTYGDYGIVALGGAPAEKIRKALDAAARELGLDANIVLVPSDDAGLEVSALRYKTYGLSDDQVRALANPTQIVMLSIATPTNEVLQTERAARSVVRAVVTPPDLIFDPWTGEAFSRATFDERRHERTAFDPADWFVIHSVPQDNGFVFLETRGLARFGLPELFLRDVPNSALSSAELLNETARTLFETKALARDGELTVHGPKGSITWSVRWTRGIYDETTPPRLLELVVPGPGDAAERLHRAIDTVLGPSPGTAVGVDHDDAELKAASARAREELAALAPHFADGIPDMEDLMVKAPFPTDDGKNEWMWVEVQQWTGGKLVGVLANQPESIRDLAIGARVEVAIGDVYDYLHRRADGTEAGGATIEIMKRKYPRQ